MDGEGVVAAFAISAAGSVVVVATTDTCRVAILLPLAALERHSRQTKECRQQISSSSDSNTHKVHLLLLHRLLPLLWVSG